MELYLSAQSSSQKEHFVNTNKKLLEHRNWTFPIVCYSTWKFEPFSNILSVVAVILQFRGSQYYNKNFQVFHLWQVRIFPPLLSLTITSIHLELFSYKHFLFQQMRFNFIFYTLLLIIATTYPSFYRFYQFHQTSHS